MKYDFISQREEIITMLDNFHNYEKWQINKEFLQETMFSTEKEKKHILIIRIAQVEDTLKDGDYVYCIKVTPDAPNGILTKMLSLDYEVFHNILEEEKMFFEKQLKNVEEGHVWYQQYTDRELSIEDYKKEIHLYMKILNKEASIVSKGGKIITKDDILESDIQYYFQVETDEGPIKVSMEEFIDATSFFHWDFIFFKNIKLFLPDYDLNTCVQDFLQEKDKYLFMYNGSYYWSLHWLSITSLEYLQIEREALKDIGGENFDEMLEKQYEKYKDIVKEKGFANHDVGMEHDTNNPFFGNAYITDSNEFELHYRDIIINDISLYFSLSDKDKKMLRKDFQYKIHM